MNDGRDDGYHGVGTFEEWLERFELMATTLSWSSQTRLVNLITAELRK